MLKEQVREFLNEQIEALQRAVGFNVPVCIGAKPMPDAAAIYSTKNKTVVVCWLTAYGWYRSGSVWAARKTLLHEFAHYLVDQKMTQAEKQLLGDGHNAVFMVLFQLLAASGLPTSAIIPKSPIWFYDFCEEKILSPEESLGFFEECRKRLVKYNGPVTVRQIMFLLHALHHNRLKMAA